MFKSGLVTKPNNDVKNLTILQHKPDKLYVFICLVFG